MVLFRSLTSLDTRYRLWNQDSSPSCPYHDFSLSFWTVLSTLFCADDRLDKKLGGVFKLTFQHARNLGVFVTIYKTLMYLQSSMRGGREEGLDSFFAGLVGGCYIFGNDSAVVQQVVSCGSWLTVDEFVCVCTSYAGSCKNGDQEWCC
jgi:hypothetical protein